MVLSSVSKDTILSASVMAWAIFLKLRRVRSSAQRALAAFRSVSIAAVYSVLVMIIFLSALPSSAQVGRFLWTGLRPVSACLIAFDVHCVGIANHQPGISFFQRSLFRHGLIFFVSYRLLRTTHIIQAVGFHVWNPLSV